MKEFDLNYLKIGFISAWRIIESRTMLIYSISLGESNKKKPLEAAFFIDWALANMFYRADANLDLVWEEEALPYLEKTA